jgi:hypothetical protein
LRTGLLTLQPATMSCGASAAHRRGETIREFVERLSAAAADMSARGGCVGS